MVFEQFEWLDRVTLVEALREDRVAGERLLIQVFGRSTRFLLQKRQVGDVEACLNHVVKEVADLVCRHSAIKNRDVPLLLRSTLSYFASKYAVESAESASDQAFRDAWFRLTASERNALNGIFIHQMTPMEACGEFGLNRTDLDGAVALLSTSLLLIVH